MDKVAQMQRDYEQRIAVQRDRLSMFIGFLDETGQMQKFLAWEEEKNLEKL